VAVFGATVLASTRAVIGVDAALAGEGAATARAPRSIKQAASPHSSERHLGRGNPRVIDTSIDLPG
jgi:hypothetical protein